MEEVKFIGYISNLFRTSEEPNIDDDEPRTVITIDGYLHNDLTNHTNAPLIRLELFGYSHYYHLTSEMDLDDWSNTPIAFYLTLTDKEDSDAGIFNYYQSVLETYRYMKILNIEILEAKSNELNILNKQKERLYDSVSEKIKKSLYKLKIKHSHYIRNKKLNLITEPVGQGAMSRLITGDGFTKGLFDVGHGTPIRKEEITKNKYKFSDDLSKTEVIFLSHWDEDHFQLATHEKFSYLLELYWYFPFSLDIIVNNDIDLAFAYEPRLLVWETILKIVKNNKFMIINHETRGQITLGANKAIQYSCGKKEYDSNNRGIVYILSEKQNKICKRILIPGDADYTINKEWFRLKYTSIIASHHGSKYLSSLELPLPDSKESKLAISFGFNDQFKHPSTIVIVSALLQGYKVEYTSCPYWKYIPNYKNNKLNIYNHNAFQIKHFE